MKTLWISMGWMATDEEFLKAVDGAVPAHAQFDTRSLEDLQALLLANGLSSSLFELAELSELDRRYHSAFEPMARSWQWRRPRAEAAALIGICCCDHKIRDHVVSAASDSKGPLTEDFLEAVATTPVDLSIDLVSARRVREFVRLSNVQGALDQISTRWIIPDTVKTPNDRCSPAPSLGKRYVHSLPSATAALAAALLQEIDRLEDRQEADRFLDLVARAVSRAGEGLVYGRGIEGLLEG